MKSKKGRTTKTYAINIERKRLLKQRRENVLQNARDRKLAKGNPLVALQANQKAKRASNDTQSITNTNDEKIDNNDTDNAAIDAENTDNAAIDAENTGNAVQNADNTATDGKKSDDAAMSDINTDNATPGHKHMDNTAIGETVLYQYLCLHVMVERPKIQAKLKPPQNICLLWQNLQ